MFDYKLQPRLSETDGMGHIHNTWLPGWFEEARRELFKIFNPEFTLKNWNLILKKYEIEMHHQIGHDHMVNITTGIREIGTTSLTVFQQALQNENLVATAVTVLIHFDYQKQVPAKIPEDVKAQLLKHMTV
jgi:acyl-CoA thioester hydrolase